METEGQRLTDWVINKIITEYKEDVCVLIAHTALKLEKDKKDAAFSYYITESDKGLGLARTFIVAGIGYDLFPRTWERMERVADLSEGNTTVLGDARILYARSERDREHFEALQAKLRKNLQDPEYRLTKGLERLDISMEIYKTMMFEEELYKVWKGSSYIANYLGEAVAMVNGTWYTKLVEDLSVMKSVPRNFISLYEAIVRAGSAQELKTLCHEMIDTTRRFLKEEKGTSKKEGLKRDFRDLANWYQELIYTWRRIYHFCDEKDAVGGFSWGSFLQSELDIVSEEFGLDEMDLMGVFKSDDLTAFRKRAETLQKEIASAIEQEGVKIEAYASVAEFVAKNS